ncbi:MAG: AmmeMemoRadiSam system protein B [Methanomassiliicoccales archaeon]|nr:AmmeMemoRadiSam system protein B [Methanomassiliicoccales archaeon]
MVRRAAVAGQFYSSSREALLKEVEGCFLSPLGPGHMPQVVKKGERRLVGAVAPHAGLVFSGPVAAHVYAEMAKDGIPETVVIIGPNHTGYGRAVSACSEDFETPLGTVKVDREIVARLRGVVEIDRTAHLYEHSLEVQLPFLQYLSSVVKIVPIVMGQQDLVIVRETAKILKEACQGKDILFLASSDFSHYVSAETAKENDGKVLDRILDLDAEGVMEVVEAGDISMCGPGPVATMMLASGGSKARLLHYGNSGDVRPMDQVVGYAAVVVEK